MSTHSAISRTHIALEVAMITIFIIILALMGREFLSDSGFGVWTGGWTQNTSQWMADPYSFSHILHGIFFFWGLWIFRNRMSLGMMLLIATFIEIAWEILENSPIIIDRYRAATASLEYYGDSILNAVFDVIFCILGFWMAYRWSWKIVLVFVMASELLMLWFIRDNLTLNILMLLYPIEVIKQWQIAV